MLMVRSVVPITPVCPLGKRSASRRGSGGCGRGEAGRHKAVGWRPGVEGGGGEVARALNTARVLWVVWGSSPATKKFALLPGLLGSAWVPRHDGWSPATLNST